MDSSITGLKLVKAVAGLEKNWLRHVHRDSLIYITVEFGPIKLWN
jgi:hypothetical protein